jgi:cyclic beta-1,2-glucan synthetase
LKTKPLQDFLSQIRISFLGEDLLRKYENEKSPLRAELFSTEQMELYAKSLAAEHTLSAGNAPEQLLKRLAENEAMLLEVHHLITESAKENSLIAPAGEWLLDNFYLIEEQIYTGKKHLPKGYSETLPRLAKGAYAGLPRVYALAMEIISHSDGRVDINSLFSFVQAYQSVTPLKLGELWAIPIMLRLALIENLRRLAAQLAIDRININLADYWADRMTETAEKDPKSLIVVTADMARSDPPMSSAFVAELTRRLLGKGPALTLPLTWIEQRLSESGLTGNGLVHHENQKQAADQVSMSNCIGSLRFLNSTDWQVFVEMSSVVEEILLEDMDGVYGNMDFHTRDYYRHVVEKISKYSNFSEQQVARAAIQLAKDSSLQNDPVVMHHVGYYLTGKGVAVTEKLAGMKVTGMDAVRKFISRYPVQLYINLSMLITLLLTGVMVLTAFNEGLQLHWIIAAGILSAIGVSHLAITFVNWLVTLVILPHFLPRLDYSKGIPPESRTLVVVPTLFSNAAELESLVETMEVRYLANKDAHLHFALLTDFTDAKTETLPEDESLLNLAAIKIHELNKKYQREKNDTFFIFHRPRRWNHAEKCWMGYERKRGKLSELNALLRGVGYEKFSLVVGDETLFSKIRYVITLDTDTQLPRDAAMKIISTIAHPLNRAFYNEKKKRVTAGYGILQPRLATSLPRTNSSLYAKMHGNEPGIDPYTRAVSDVYQDLLQEGSFIGKGIYELDVFEMALDNRFPENRILSHDLLEGCYARSGLISEVQLYEEYPVSYRADMKRRHRWIRGDWQIARWLFPRVPGPGNHTQKNPLSTLSRWKIFDNLRRSLVPPALLLLLIFGWIISSSLWFWTISVIGMIVTTTLFSFLWDIYKKPADTLLLKHTVNSFRNVLTNLLQHVFTFICLPYEALINLDAIIRTNWRMIFSHKNLLEWNPSTSKSRKKDTLLSTCISMWIGPFTGTALFIYLTYYSPLALVIATPILLLWIASPLVAWWISAPYEPGKELLNTGETIFLQQLARKTWSFFEDFVGNEDNWLPPDNYQEHMVSRIAHRTSPTNMGLSLLANLSACDFGYITPGTLIDRTIKAINTMQQLEKYHGHFYNWYDTRSLAVLSPKYISSVDSGNLAGHLLVLKQGLLSQIHKKIIPSQLFEGLRDTVSVLASHTKENRLVQEFSEVVTSVITSNTNTPDQVRHHLHLLLSLAKEIADILNGETDNNARRWSSSLLKQCEQATEEIKLLVPWLNIQAAPEKFADLSGELLVIPTLHQLAGFSEVWLPKLDAQLKISENAEESDWLGAVRVAVIKGAALAKERIIMLEQLAQHCHELSNMDYDFLYDKTKNLLSIGYNVDEHRRDPGFYDLLGSEVRFGVFVAISQGKIPQESWFALGRQLTNPGTDPVLLSWSGSMFEYLMPLLVMPNFENTLLDQTIKGTVQRQIEYGRKHSPFWGNSESGYNMTDAQLNYQYRAFGVPGLGLKRGLGDDFVIAPYASVMALMVSPGEAVRNLEKMQEEGFEGKYGFFEAIDYTPARVPRGQTYSIVKSYMAHHQGMSLLSLAYHLLDQPMQHRFEAEAQFQATLLLLQERVPKVTSYYTPTIAISESGPESTEMQMRVINTANTPVPEVQLLSNGNYHVMVTNSGGGYSRWKDTAITRWREDATCDNWGTFCFIRDLEHGQFWSAAHQPTLKQAENFEVIFSQGRAEFRRRDHNIETHTEIVVSSEDDAEMRRVHITNRSRKRRTLEVTSYGEVVLNNAVSDAIHPAFSNLFVQTEIIPARHAILCTRRARSMNEQPPSMFHLMKIQGAKIQDISYETNRDAFIGRGNTIVEPAAMNTEKTLSGAQGSVLDPIVAIQYRITLQPQETVVVDMVFGIGATRELCNVLIEKYQDRHMIDRAFELAWTHNQVLLRQINASEDDAQLYSRLAGSVIYANASMRAEAGTLIRNQRGQSGLWSYSVSGDLPIVLLQVEDSTNIELVKQLIQAHAYWRFKGLVVDLIIWNEDHGGYRQTLQNQILALINPGITTDLQEKPGGIFIRSADQISNEDRILFQTVARVVISDKMGTLEGQINRRSRLKGIVPLFTPLKFYPTVETTIPFRTNLQFFNGLGGFSPDGKEYLITTTADNVTPAPWVNVLANPKFGTVISESGQSYTWIDNAHEFRLTPWSNDPVSDSGGENFYLRDEESGRFWSPAPLPGRSKAPYTTRHGFGYSVFEHSEDGMQSEMWVYVDVKEAIKFTVIKVRNLSGRDRRLSATGYAEWVLGDLRSKTAMHIVTEVDLNSGAIFAFNAYNTEFANRVAFFDVNDARQSITTDRTEFIGRNGTLRNPDALNRARLSGKTGAALDPCAVIQVAFDVADGEEYEIVFRIGCGTDTLDAAHLVKQFRGRTAAREALERVRKYWSKTLTAIQIETPDAALNILANGWINYQTIACRLWARSGFYQSGGAFGFRDQLQDVLSILLTSPDLARAQILLCASRQFKEGDVQHWWHPPTGRGVRTRCSDDYLWLPFVTARYVITTGDAVILEELVTFLDGRLLNAGEESYYDLPLQANQSADLYTHCVKAIQHALQFGVHGLPLIGSGDWNDGMDKVGEEGKGESVWLGFFLYDVLAKFSEIAELKGDLAFQELMMSEASKLKKNISLNAWDGEWYRRAYFDNGTPLGSKENDECQIDSIVQSWSVISRASDLPRSLVAMDAADKRLVREEDGIIQLFDPPFDASNLNPGYIKGYVPGVRENGGQYTHAAIWMIIAFAMTGEKKRAWELLKMINPVYHGSTPGEIAIYKVEPYVIAADVYAIPDQVGRGGWTWYTGSAGWLYQLIIEVLLGIKAEGNVLKFDPCLPPKSESIKITYKYRTAVYSIMLMPEQRRNEKIRITLDGALQNNNSIPLLDDGLQHEVKVMIG